jgi:hypothetical protein
MKAKDRIHGLIKEISREVLQFIQEHESQAHDRWVPASQIKQELELNFVAVPRANEQYGGKGWFFAIIARMLEDESLIEYKKVGRRAYYRSITAREL